MITHRFYFDIETAPLPMQQLDRVMPEFEAPLNIKDESKIKAAIETKKAEWIDKAALKAITGHIIAVTFARNDGLPAMATRHMEADLIGALLEQLKQVIGSGGRAYAWNGNGFDLPFLCQRAAVCGIQAFSDLTVCVKGRFYWNESLIDPRLVWSMYSTDYSGASLDAVAKALGVGEKNGNGKDFVALLKSDPVQAELYAKNDIELLRGIVKRMGI